MTTSWIRPLQRAIGCSSLIIGLLLGGCTGGLGVKPIVKIGLVAPFEGYDRPLGYQVLAAVKLALRQRNAAGGAGGVMVELVALNDDQDPAQAVEQARELVLDPDVMGAIGHFSDATTRAALPVYHAAGLALIIPTADAVACPGYPEVVCLRPPAGQPAISPEFARAYQEYAGTAPTEQAALSYNAAVLLMDAIAAATRAEGRPTRAGLIARLPAR